MVWVRRGEKETHRKKERELQKCMQGHTGRKNAIRSEYVTQIAMLCLFYQIKITKSKLWKPSKQHSTQELKYISHIINQNTVRYPIKILAELWPVSVVYWHTNTSGAPFKWNSSGIRDLDYLEGQGLEQLPKDKASVAYLGIHSVYYWLAIRGRLVPHCCRQPLFSSKRSNMLIRIRHGSKMHLTLNKLSPATEVRVLNVAAVRVSITTFLIGTSFLKEVMRRHSHLNTLSWENVLHNMR